jgi:hypothetical protein
MNETVASGAADHRQNQRQGINLRLSGSYAQYGLKIVQNNKL